MRTITLSLVLCLAGLPLAGGSALAKAAAPARGQYQGQYQDQPGAYDYETYTPQQLDNLLAPIALYPDPLLAQVLIAATFPDQLQDASDWVRRYGPANPGLDEQPWDISVRAVAHYPAVLYMMNDKIDWTTAVGQAYVNQSTDTIASIQNLRGLARAEGNLFSTPQQQVVVDGGYIQILPAEPQYIFVPTYDAGAIYSRRVYTGNSFGGFFSFGSGFAIGAWLNYDVDWGSRRVVYNNWQGGGWRQRSRPFVQVNNNVYINNRYQNVIVNRTVVNRPVDVQKVNQFNSVHSNVKFGDRPRGNGQPGGRPNNGGNPNAGGNPNNDANRNPRTVQPSQPQQRPADGFNRGGQGQGQPAPAAPQQQPQVLRQNNSQNSNNGGNANRSGIRGGEQNPGGQNGTPGNEIRVRGQGQNQTPPPATPQQTPPVQQRNFPQQNNNGNNNGNRGQQNQAPPARVEPARPIPPAAQPPPAAPAQQQRPVQEQQRPAQEQRQQAAPAPPPQQQRPAQEQRQAAPAQQGGQAKGQQDRGGNKGQDNTDNKDNKKGGNDRPN